MKLLHEMADGVGDISNGKVLEAELCMPYNLPCTSFPASKAHLLSSDAVQENTPIGPRIGKGLAFIHCSQHVLSWSWNTTSIVMETNRI